MLIEIIWGYYLIRYVPRYSDGGYWIQDIIEPAFALWFMSVKLVGEFWAPEDSVWQKSIGGILGWSLITLFAAAEVWSSYGVVRDILVAIKQRQRKSPEKAKQSLPTPAPINPIRVNSSPLKQDQPIADLKSLSPHHHNNNHSRGMVLSALASTLTAQKDTANKGEENKRATNRPIARPESVSIPPALPSAPQPP
jgi:hypothetical protein